MLSHAFALVLIAATQVAPNVHLIRGEFVPGQQPDGNSVIFTTREGLIVFDTGRHVAHTQKILDFAKETKKPVRSIVNSHWHLDHIGGNLLLRREYPRVRIYASGAFQDARQGFLGNYRKQLVEMLAKNEDAALRAELGLIDAGDQLAPTDVIDVPRTVGPLHLHIQQNAVTAGDVWAWDPKSCVLAAGDLVTLPAPFLDTACPANWNAVLTRLSKMPFTTLIPGHGAPMTHAELETYRTAFGNLIACDGAKEACVEGWMRDAAPLLANEDAKLTRALMDYYVDLLRGGKLCR